MERITGVSWDELSFLRKKFYEAGAPGSPEDVSAALAMMEGRPNKDLVDLNPILGNTYGSSKYVAGALRFLKAVQNVTVVDPRYRFAWRNPNVPSATCVVDGTPVGCYGPLSLLQNFKYKTKCVKFEMYVTMDGVPFAFKGPYIPRTHDAAVFHDGIPFEHGTDELMLGDKGYIGCAHVMTPFKCRGGDEDDLPVWQGIFNERIHCPRAYIEHCLSDMKAHGFRHQTRSFETIHALVKLYVDTYFLLMSNGYRKPRYRDYCVPGEAPAAVACLCTSDPQARQRAVLIAKAARLGTIFVQQVPTPERKHKAGEGSRRTKRNREAAASEDGS